MLGSFLCFLGTLTSGTSGDACTVESVEGGEFLFVFSDSAELDDWLGLGDWHNCADELCREFTFLFGGFTLAQFAVLVDWEENQLALIFLQALNVLLTGFNRLVATTLVNGNSDGAGESRRETSSLKIKSFVTFRFTNHQIFLTFNSANENPLPARNFV